MKDLYDYINISGIPIEKRIELSIAETKKSLEGLDVNRTCIIYSNHVFSYLSKNHVVSKIINTKDLGAEYEHCFNLIPINSLEYYLVDLTYPQFQNDAIFKDLYEKGYEKVTDLNFYLYYAIVTGEQSKVTIKDALLGKVKGR